MKRIEKLANEKRVARSSSAYKLVVLACNNGNDVIRPCWTSGSGRFTSNMDYTADTCKLLGLARVKYITGNNSPRGGKCGNWIRIDHFEK